MKRTSALILLIVFIISSFHITAGASSGAAAEIRSFREIPGITAEEISAIEKLRAERAAFSYGHLTEKEAFQLSNGAYAGFTPELCELLSELFDTSFIRKPYDNLERLNVDLEGHFTDFTGEFTPTVDRKLSYKMSSKIADREQTLYTLSDSAEISLETKLDGAKLGFLENGDNKEYILKQYPEITFEDVTVPDVESVEAMLVSGEIDAFVTERAFDSYFDGNDNIRSKPLFRRAFVPVSLSTANPELEPFISAFDKYLAAGGIDKLQQMYIESEKEYVKQLLINSFTDKEREYLSLLKSTGGKVRIALEHDHYPVSFYNQAENRFEGIAADILEEVTSLTGIEFENVAQADTPWIDILSMLRSGGVALVSELGYSKEREQYFIWCETPYFNSNYAFISKESYPNVKSYQIPRTRVGTIAGSYYEDMYKAWYPAHGNLSLYQTQNDVLDALEKDEIDLVLGAEYILLTQSNYREKTGYKLNYLINGGIACRFGLNKNEELLRSILDKTQKRIDIDTICGYWSNRVFDYSGELSRMRTGYLAIGLGILLFALISTTALVLRNSRLRRRLAERTMMLSTIYESLPDTLFCKNNDGVYTSCNPTFEKQAGIPESEIIGKTYKEVFGDRVTEFVEIHSGIDKKVIGSNTAERLNETVIYPDGSSKYLELIKAPLVQKGEVVGVLGIGRDITERKELTSRFEFILNTAHVAYILTIDGIVEEVNDYGRSIFGMNTGDDIEDYYADTNERDAIIVLAEKQGAASNVNVKFKLASGEVHRFVSSFAAIEYKKKKAYVHWALDIEENERKNDMLRIMQQSLQMVLDALPMPVRIFDMENAKIVYVNDSFLKLFEYDNADEICGNDIHVLIPQNLSDGSPATEIVDLILASSEPTSIEIEYVTKTGRIVEAAVATRVIDFRGRRSSIGIINDLTAEKERAKILLEAAEREKDANQAKSLFLANMSHEIRTPMNGIIGMSDLLMGDELTGRQHQYVKDIKTSAESLLDIINDILDLSKISEGRLQIAPVDIDLGMMLKNVVSMMSFTARSKGLNFVDDIRINTPEYVRVDDIRLKQIIVNLLSNAIKFTKEGYVKLSAKIEDGLINFEIRDTGVGIREEDVPLIFNAFEQVDTQKNRAIKGTGLGLSISKNLTELMGGRLWAESEYGKGTSFFVSIPYVQGDESAVEVVDAEFKYLFAPTAQILIVDDIQTNLTVAAGLLRLCGITADVATSGSEAIELVKLKNYDLVLMDHMMPEMDGIEAMRRIKGMGGKYGKLPIVALTANAVNESRALLISSGMDDFLSKPVDKTALMLVLQKWLPKDKIVSGVKIVNEGANEDYSKALSAVSGIEGINVGLALSRIGGLQSVLEESIKQMAFSIEARLKLMDSFLVNDDLASFTIEAHGFKGALANIGAVKNSELAAELEIGGKTENRPLCSEKFIEFAEVMESLAKELKAIFNDNGALLSADSKTRGDINWLDEKASEAIEFLNQFEAEMALMSLEALERFTFGAEADAFLSDAKSLIKAYKYKKAIPLLERLRKSK